MNQTTYNQQLKYNLKMLKENWSLKSLGPIHRKFYRHGKNDGFVLYEYVIKQCSSFCKK